MHTMEIGMDVVLCSSREVVAFGTLHSNDPNAVCHFRKLGNDKVSICVSKVLSPQISLKYPCGDIDTLGDILAYTGYNKPFIIWEKDDVFPKAVLTKLTPTLIDFKVGDKLRLATFDEKVVALGLLREFEQHECYLFAMMEIVSITHEGAIENAISLDCPFYEVGKVMRWSVASLKREYTRAVFFNEMDNRYYNNVDKRSNMATIHANINGDREEVVSGDMPIAQGSRSDVFSGVEEFDINGSLQSNMPIAHGSRSDVFSGVEEFDINGSLQSNTPIAQEARSDVFSGVEEFVISGSLQSNNQTTYSRLGTHCDVLSRIDDIEGSLFAGGSGSRSDVLSGVDGIEGSLLACGSGSRSDVLSGVDELDARARNQEFSQNIEAHVLENNLPGGSRHTLPSILRRCNSTSMACNISSQPEDFSVFDFIDNEDGFEMREAARSKRAYKSLKRKRIHAIPKTHKRCRMLEEDDMLNTLQKRCCRKRCMRHIEFDDIKNIRSNIWKRKGSDRSSYILTKFSCFLKDMENSSSEVKFLPLVTGKNVCHNAYQAILGISHGTYWEYVTKAKMGVLCQIHGNTSQFKMRKSTLHAEALLHTYFEENALPQPHLSHRLQNGGVATEKHLPMGLKKKEIFDAILDRLKERGYRQVSVYTLYGLWRKMFSNVKIPRRQRMSKCNTCDDLKRAIEKANDPEQTERYTRLRTYHLEHVQHSRKKYAFWREQAMAYPNKYMCLIVDGMDQNTTTLPRLLVTPPKLEGKHFLKTHLCGVLVHGIKFLADVWIDSLHLHDSNQTITSIMRAIQQTNSIQGTLPPILRIQADNCWRENKNVFMFSFCSMLVAHKIFTEVELGFLLVGHTHEDIDQVFSTISRDLKQKDVETLDDLLRRCGRQVGGRKESTYCSLLENIYDWKDFIQPYIKRGSDALKGHSNPHYFRFFLKDGKPVMQWQYYSVDTQWEPEEPYCILSSIPSRDLNPHVASIKTMTEREQKEVEGLQAFIKYKKSMAEKYPAHQHHNEYVVKKTEDLIEYLRKERQNIKSNECPIFWPQTVSRDVDDESLLSTRMNLDKAYQQLLPRPFCGKASDQPREEFMPESHIDVNDFVAMRPADEDSAVWVAKVVQLIQNREGKVTDFTALWYEPRGRTKGMSNATLYKDCMKKEWVPNKDGLQDQSISSAIVSWKSKATTMKKHHGYDVERHIRIPERCIQHIQEFLRMIEAHSKVGDDVDFDMS